MASSTPESTVTINGTTRSCTVAEARFSFTQSPATATLMIPGKFDVDHDQPAVWTLDGDVRFTGLVRDFDRDIEGFTTIFAHSPDTRLAEYQNGEDPNGWGGLTIADLTGGATATGGQLIMAVLDRVGVSYDPGHIGDNGVVLNTSAAWEPFIWSAGTDPAPLGTDMQQPGETALDYINKICRVMAVANVGFYRFFPTTGGTLYCHLIGGRPRSSPDHTFTEGIDILRGKATRRYPQANTVLVTGYNFGDGGRDGSGSGEWFRTASEDNPFMSSSRPFVYRYSSPLIERSTDGIEDRDMKWGGMSCETVANAILPDVNRQTVYVPVTLYTSALLGPGQTIHIQGKTDGEEGIMGVGAGDPLWLQDLTIRFDAEGVTQEATCIGGGVTDDSAGSPPV